MKRQRPNEEEEEQKADETRYWDEVLCEDMRAAIRALLDPLAANLLALTCPAEYARWRRTGWPHQFRQKLGGFGTVALIKQIGTVWDDLRETDRTRTTVVLGAAREGNMPLLLELERRVLLIDGQRLLRASVHSRQLSVFQWALGRLSLPLQYGHDIYGCAIRILENIAVENQLPMLRALWAPGVLPMRVRLDESFYQPVLQHFGRHRNWEAWRYLVQEIRVIRLGTVLDCAASFEQRSIIRWCLRRDPHDDADLTASYDSDDTICATRAAALLTPQTFEKAIMWQGDIAFLQWLRQIGCPWSSLAYRHALCIPQAKQVLQWLLHEDCPLE